LKVRRRNAVIEFDLIQTLAEYRGLVLSHDQRIRNIADRVLGLEDGEFKDIQELAVDPVCGMSVDQESAPAQATYEGRIIYFCARGCRDEFLEAPEQFLTEQGSVRSMSTGDIPGPIHFPEH